jgi:hypothetical protein
MNNSQRIQLTIVSLKHQIEEQLNRNAKSEIFEHLKRNRDSS